MRTIRLRTIALACSCLFAAPLSSFAQTNGGPAAASVEGDASVASGDLAAPSPRSAVTPLEMAALPSSESGAGTEPSFLEDQAPSPPDQAQAQGQGQGQAAPPAGNPAPPSLGDLGFGSEQTQGSAQDQALLDKRSHMLKIHQRLGLITTVPLVATIFSGGLAGGRSTSSGGRDLHAGLGALTAALYMTTAYYAIYAPKLPGTTVRGPIRLHKALAWIHGTGMILTPILGAIAFDQRNRGEKIHGIASAHGAVGAVTAAAYGLAILSVSLKF
ncbi:MAG TPA: hypothetical protein VOA80_13200 [Thermoanaerobaculia bacterium]|nr:hypothetical protein [Thermoanaerobaculia bacterium]